MTESFQNLEDEGKLNLAIEYVGRNVPLPEQLRAFLLDKGLLDTVLTPEVGSE